jgi:hypothetical protein
MEKIMRFPYLVLALTLCFLIAGVPTLGFAVAEADKSGSPESGGQHDMDELARHLNNPVGPVWNIVTQNNWYFQKGFPSTASRVHYVLNFQPVLPIPLTRELNLVMRPVVPLESNPYASGVSLHPLGVEWSRTAGLGDITLEPFLVPNWKPWLIFGVAPSLIMPTATKTHLGQGKVQLGPAVVLGFLTKQWIGGVFVQNWWSLAGNNSKPAVNQMNLQYFLYRMLPDAWQVGFAPNVLVNWRADGKNQVTFPIGLGAGKTFKIGALPPIQTTLEFQWMAWHPDEFGQRFNLRFVFKPVVPALVTKPILE